MTAFQIVTLSCAALNALIAFILMAANKPEALIPLGASLFFLLIATP